MRNLAGNPVSIFLYQFVIRTNAISFVVNESIAEDMYPEINTKLEPLVQACAATLSRYKHLCRTKTIMDGNILTDNHFEVMLSTGLGKHFREKEKQNLFDDAHKIAELLMEVMSRRTREMEEGTYTGPQPTVSKISNSGMTNDGLEALGHSQPLMDDPDWRPSESARQRRLSPSDLPTGVTAQRSYDHRGYCIAFHHKTLGDIGKLILSDTRQDNLQMEVELCVANTSKLEQKKKVLHDIISVIGPAIKA